MTPHPHEDEFAAVCARLTAEGYDARLVRDGDTLALHVPHGGGEYTLLAAGTLDLPKLLAQRTEMLALVGEDAPKPPAEFASDEERIYYLVTESIPQWHRPVQEEAASSG